VPPELRIIDLAAKRPVLLTKSVALWRYLTQERPDYLFSALDFVNIAGWLQRLSGIDTKVIVGVHNTLSVKFRNQAGFWAKLKPYLLRVCYLQSSKIVAVSEGVATDLAATSGLPLEKIRVIYNPVVSEDLLQRAQQKLDHPWFRPGEPPVILGVGRLATAKDFPID
jgi:glycosyltransferase involved in cell wall biosynthesis